MADPDRGCGCGRAFTGCTSARGTTTAKVADIPRASLLRDGWDGDHLASLADAAAPFPAGAIVERRLDVLRIRPQHAPQS